MSELATAGWMYLVVSLIVCTITRYVDGSWQYTIFHAKASVVFIAVVLLILTIMDEVVHG